MGVSHVERRPTKDRIQHSVFKGTEKPEITKSRVKPGAPTRYSEGAHYDTDTVWDVGFRYTYLHEGFIEEGKAMYSKNTPVVLPLNLGETPKQNTYGKLSNKRLWLIQGHLVLHIHFISVYSLFCRSELCSRSFIRKRQLM